MNVTEEVVNRLDKLVRDVVMLGVSVGYPDGMTPGEYGHRVNKLIESCARSIVETIGAEADEKTTTRHGKYKIRYGREVPLCEICGYGIRDERYNFCPKCGARIVEDQR